jgi:lysophospholipase L1-like esterase
MKRRAAAFAANLALSLGAIVFVLVVAEIGIRLLSPQDVDYYDARRFTDLSGRFPSLIPNSSSTFTGVPIRINARGLRDDEIAVPKPPGTSRILAIGDSVTFGFGVRAEETYVKRLEARLRAANPVGRRIEVVNAGVGATGLDYYLYALETRGPRLQPDLVLVGIVLNDIYDYESSQATGVRPSLAAVVSTLNQAALLHSHLYLKSYLGVRSHLYRIGVLDIRAMHANTLLAFAPPSPRLEQAWTSTLRLLDRIIVTARAQNTCLLLVIFPMEFQLDAGRVRLYNTMLNFGFGPEVLAATPQRRLVEFAQARRVPVVDLLPRLRQSAGEELYLRNKAISFDWVHPSPTGHEVVADEIYRGLQRLPIAWRPGAPRGLAFGGCPAAPHRRRRSRR